MRWCLVILVFALLLVGCSSDDKSSAVSTVAEGAVSGTVKFFKDLERGVDDGFKTGRKSSESVDGARIVTNAEEFSSCIEVKLLEILQDTGDMTRVVVGFQNRCDTPQRIARLSSGNTIIALDDQDFATELSDSTLNPFEVTVPEHAGKKESFLFAAKPESISKIRIFGLEYTR